VTKGTEHWVCAQKMNTAGKSIGPAAFASTMEDRGGRIALSESTWREREGTRGNGREIRSQNPNKGPVQDRMRFDIEMVNGRGRPFLRT